MSSLRPPITCIECGCLVLDPGRCGVCDIRLRRSSGTLPARLVADLIGKPYLDRGRGPDMFDCEGLFLEVQRRLGYDGRVPFLGSMTDRARAWLRIADRGWQQLQAPVPGCAVFFPADLHVGTMYDSGRFLHTSSELGEAFIDNLDSPHWKGKHRLFYTWGPR